MKIKLVFAWLLALSMIWLASVIPPGKVAAQAIPTPPPPLPPAVQAWKAEMERSRASLPASVIDFDDVVTLMSAGSSPGAAILPSAAPEPRSLGTVTVTAGPSTCAAPHEDEQCYAITVGCDELAASIGAAVMVGGAQNPASGTIALHSGWDGTYWWEDWGPNYATIVNQLQAAGFRTVQIRWNSNWWAGASNKLEGHARLACRPATVLRWAYDNLHAGTGTPFCAEGHSNGATAVGHAITQYGLADLFSLVLFESGPNFARLDYGCIQDTSDPAHQALFYGTGERGHINWSLGLSQSTGACVAQDESFRGNFEEASLAHDDNWQYSYPGTKAAFVFGEDDLSTTAVHGLTYHNRVVDAGSPLVSMTVVTDTGHGVGDTPQGMVAISDTLINECVYILPEITALSLVQSPDTVAWTAVYGDLASGYRIDLDPELSFQYLNINALSANKPLRDGLHPFMLNTAGLPVGFYPYWDARGVNAAAAPDTWQAWMWQIINGDQPVFYLKVNGATYKLVDGLLWDTTATEEYLRVSGDYPLGAYNFNGVIEDQIGGSANVTATIIFEPLPAITALNLVRSADTTTWTPVAGDLSGGFIMDLDGSSTFEFLDVRDVATNKTLQNGLHPFTVNPDSLPDGWLNYWAGRGVVEGAPGWQGVMWEIINGRQPIFYLKVDAGSYRLVDGLVYLIGGGEEYLRVDGSYLLGAYRYTGSITDTVGGITRMSVELSFQASYVPAAPVTTITVDGEDALITWTPVLTDSQDNFTVVTGYLVYLNDQPYFDPEGVTPEPVDKATFEYRHAGAITSLLNDYYIVRAVNILGPSADSGLAGKFTFSLVTP